MVVYAYKPIYSKAKEIRVQTQPLLPSKFETSPGWTTKDPHFKNKINIFWKIPATLYPLVPLWRTGSQNLSVPAVFYFGFIFNEEIIPGALGWTRSSLTFIIQTYTWQLAYQHFEHFFPVAFSISFSPLSLFSH